MSERTKYLLSVAFYVLGVALQISGFQNTPLALLLFALATVALAWPAIEPAKRLLQGETALATPPRELLAAVLIGAAGIALFVWLSPKAPGLEPLGWLLLIVASALIIGFLIFMFALLPIPASTLTAPRPTTALPKTLRDLFSSDFGLLRVDQSFEVGAVDGPRTTITCAVHFDFNAHAKFLSFYVPHTQAIVDVCMALAETYKVAMENAEGGVQVIEKRPGDWSGTSKGDLGFSGRVFVYHEDDLTVRQVADLTDLFKAKGLAVQFRGPSYVVTNMLVAQASSGRT